MPPPGNSIRVTVLDIRGNKVRLGIEAPADVRVHREELIARGVLDFAFTGPGEEPSYTI